jgi:hypothetical protein
LANPATLSIGTRITWVCGFVPFGPPLLPLNSSGPTAAGPYIAGYAGSPPPPQFALAPQVAGMVTTQGAALPGLCQTVNGSAPDFTGSTAVVHDQAGKTFIVVMGQNTATWTSGGSLPGVAHWQFTDLSA